jgi:hypothetical protein
MPAVGVDTAWASATAAYDLLPTAMKQAVESLQAVHSFEHSGWPPYFEQLPNGAELYALGKDRMHGKRNRWYIFLKLSAAFRPSQFGFAPRS